MGSEEEEIYPTSMSTLIVNMGFLFLNWAFVRVIGGQKDAKNSDGIGCVDSGHLQNRSL